ncbi:MAG: hypothetical protein HKN92_10835 [Chitinophagales bacterium]|nr:hypothetical protein [Chitinophagales bacterium]
MKRLALTYLSCGILLINCGETGSGDPVPKISLENISETQVVEFIDSIVITVHYEDGDGDLGFSDPDSNSLWVKDDRLEKADLYYIPQLAPEDASIAIEGDINIRLRNTFLIGSGGEEFTRYTIRLKDRAGNWSNEVVTPIITVRK